MAAAVANYQAAAEACRVGRSVQASGEVTALLAQLAEARSQLAEQVKLRVKAQKQQKDTGRLARKQAVRARRIEFQRGVQAQRAIGKQAKREKRRGKAWRKGQEGVKRRKLAARRRAEATPHGHTAAASQHSTWHAPGFRPPPHARSPKPPPPPPPAGRRKPSHAAQAEWKQATKQWKQSHKCRRP